MAFQPTVGWKAWAMGLCTLSTDGVLLSAMVSDNKLDDVVVHIPRHTSAFYFGRFDSQFDYVAQP